MSVTVLSRCGPDGRSHTRRRFDGEPASLHSMRDVLLDASARTPEADWDEVALMATELATNAIRYGIPHPGERHWFELRLMVDDTRLRVEVVSPGPPFEPEIDPAVPAFATSGRGLLLVDALSAAWGVRGEDPEPERLTCVWFESRRRAG